MSTESLTSKVYETRVDLGITQQQLADATGISVRTIISIEKGRQFPTLLSAMRIAHYFSLSVDQLFEYKCEDNTEKEKITDKR
jgi:putative transcriptional regulator